MIDANEDKKSGRSWFSDVKELAADEVKGMAIDKIIGTLSGGWLDGDSFGFGDEDDADDEKNPTRNESFNERLERELAKLHKDEGQLTGNNAPQAENVPSAFDECTQVELTRLAAERQQNLNEPLAQKHLRAAVAPRGFGRKIV